MRKPILFFTLAGALAAIPVLAQKADAGADAGAGTPRQFGQVVGVPTIWPRGAADAGPRDAGAASSIQW